MSRSILVPATMMRRNTGPGSRERSLRASSDAAASMAESGLRRSWLTTAMSRCWTRSACSRPARSVSRSLMSSRTRRAYEEHQQHGERHAENGVADDDAAAPGRLPGRVGAPLVVVEPRERRQGTIERLAPDASRRDFVRPPPPASTRDMILACSRRRKSPSAASRSMLGPSSGCCSVRTRSLAIVGGTFAAACSNESRSRWSPFAAYAFSARRETRSPVGTEHVPRSQHGRTVHYIPQRVALCRIRARAA